ncbi:GntR family transcriptional regulator [Paenibacillus sp. CF384]|uniref:GntR family transcriptional regulator n=1 Tax=Paenibacillus sp. CF384 TaxID=1884382 RepID=UPI00089A6C03|nr:GntR family transcriptional regulator [Paenibacillus sp. CF384]SDX97555.1 GntR family transcriptional regulator [Paenibacillus sp. CF384]
MISNRFCLTVDHQVNFGVHTQMKEQLKWLIGTGQLKPGDPLPAASHLADLLGLNRNTVNGVYSQLKVEGLVSMQKGKGTQVLGGAATERLRRKAVPMKRLLDGVIKGARAEKMDLQELFMAGLGYSLLQSGLPTVPARILLVESKDHDLYFYQEEIERVTGLEVCTIFLEDLLEGTRTIKEARPNDIWVTSLNQANRAKAILAPLDKKVHVVEVTVDTSIVLELATLQRDSHISFVSHGQTGGEWMLQRIRDDGITHLCPVIIGIDEHDNLEKALRRSTKIYTSNAVYTELKQLAPDKVQLFKLRLERSSENLLRELAASDLNYRYGTGFAP